MHEIVKLDPRQLADGPWRFSDNGANLADGSNTKHSVQKSMNALATSFRMLGQLQPVLVRPNPDGFPKYQIIDGHGRRDVAAVLEMPEIDAIVVNAEDSKALAMYVTANLTRLCLDHIKISKVLGALAKTITEKGVISLLPWEDHNTESYINLANYDWREFIGRGAAQYQDVFAVGADGEDDEESNGIDL